ncbi:MAG: hypothetical protein ACI825_000228, partial [Planctomycetota bacterium]
FYLKRSIKMLQYYIVLNVNCMLCNPGVSNNVKISTFKKKLIF